MNTKRQLLLLSASSPHGYKYLEYAKNDIKALLDKNKVEEVLFVPYALKDHDAYTKQVKEALGEWGYKVLGIHTYETPKNAVDTAQAIFIGGGNTFRLLNTLYDYHLISAIRKRVLEDGIPYIGSSAGTNVATVNICTTNDMPIVYPPSFDALRLVPFNINPHYVDPIPDDTHKGETREERIVQLLECHSNARVLGLREGATLHVEGNHAILKGVAGAKLFKHDHPAEEYEVGADVSFLMHSEI